MDDKLIISQFLSDVNMNVADVSRAMRYTYTHTYNVLKGNSPVTEAFLWRFYSTFVDSQSPFYLQGADSALRILSNNSTH